MDEFISPYHNPIQFYDEPRRSTNLVQSRDRLNNVMDLVSVCSSAIDNDSLKVSQSIAIVLEIYVRNELIKLKEELESFDTI